MRDHSLLLSLFLCAALAGCSDSTSSARASSTGSGPDKASDKPGAAAAKPGPGGPDATKGAGKGAPPALVELAQVQAGTLEDGWTYLGRVEAALASDLATAVSGHVLSVRGREGDRVVAGKTLVTLDSAKILAELAASRARESGLDAELVHARKQYERIAKLEYPAVSEPERERYQLDIAKLEAQLATQKAETRRLQVELDRHSLEAPFDGIISARHIDPGAWVNPGTPVLSLVSLEELEVHVDVSADLGSRVAVGQHATLSAPGMSGARVEAEIAGIVGVLDVNTRTMRVRLTPKERPAWLLSGQAVDVEFPVTLSGESAGAAGQGPGVLVPRDALVRGPVRTRVIKFEDGEAVPVYVNILATAKDMALVQSQPDEPALEPGESVVVRGNERLRPGQALKVKE